METHTHTPAGTGIARSLFLFALIYGGMVTIAGVLGVKQVALGPLAVEAGIFPFLTLVVLSSAVTELHGAETGNRLVRWGFLPLILSMALIQLVLALPSDEGMWPPAVSAFPTVLGSSARLMLAGLIAYGVSQTLNVLIFDKLRAMNAGAAWLRGGIASVLSQIVDTVLFISIGFLGTRAIGDLIVGQALTKVALSILIVPLLITLLVRWGRRLDASGAAA